MNPTIGSVAQKMKAEIASAIAGIIARYDAEHEMVPSAIRVDMVETTALGKPREFVLGDVTIEFTF